MNFIALLIFTGAINGILLCLILFSKKYKTHKSNYFMGFFILIITFNLIEHFITFGGYISNFPHIMAVFVPFFFMLGPLYFFYVKSLIDIDFSFNKRDLAHFIPALICFLTILPYYLQPGDMKLQQFLSFDSAKRDQYDTDYKILYHLIMFIQCTIYIILSIIHIRNKAIFEDGRSNKKALWVLKWLRYFSVIFIAFIVMYILIYTYITYIDFFIFETLNLYTLFTSVFIYFVGYWSLNKLQVLHQADYPRRDKEKIEPPLLKEKIRKLFEEEEVYLDPDLDLYKLSKMVDINRLYLSKYINSEYNRSFTDFVNFYRISQAKKLIHDPRYEHYNLLGIGMKVGFSSKNTFTRAFQKLTGLTPSQYKKEKKVPID